MNENALRQTVLFTTGLGFLTLAKAKHTLKGYSTPKPLDISQVEACLDYDERVAREFVEYLGEAAHADGDATLRGRDVLELGPGSDFGVGLELCARGAKAYHACDVNALARKAPDRFYDAMMARLSQRFGSQTMQQLQPDLERARRGERGRIDYVVRDDFDIVDAFGENSMDVMFSNAAFEHFDDCAATIRQVSAVCRPGAYFVASIDMATHSRWIREADPNNIYRYPDWLYRLFHFRGMPNRVRPHQFEAALRKNGWVNVRARPVGGPAPEGRRLASKFHGPENRMGWLTVLVTARKPG